MADNGADHRGKERLQQLEDRIAAVKSTQKPAKDHQDEHYSQANMAWRMVTELVAGLGVGFCIGLGLDTVFGTKPLLMVLFIFFGLAAGVKTMLRTAKEIEKKKRRQVVETTGRNGEKTDHGD